MKKFLIILSVFILTLAGGFYVKANADYPELKDGDLIFQTSMSNQSSAILVATASRFTHMGIIKHKGDNIVVVEAAAQVGETPLQDWIKRGTMGRVAIYRYPNLNQKQIDKILAYTRTKYGKPYDIFFSFKNDAYYCSEVPYLAFKNAGLSIGEVQKISELNFDNAVVKELIAQRWERHAECKAKKYNFEACYQHILQQELVTPASIAEDSRLEKIYSNYPL